MYIYIYIYTHMCTLCGELPHPEAPDISILVGASLAKKPLKCWNVGSNNSSSGEKTLGVSRIQWFSNHGSSVRLPLKTFRLLSSEGLMSND